MPGGDPSTVGADSGLDPSTLLQRAEMAMLAAKAKQEPLQIYRPSMGEVYRRRFQLVTQFRQAVEQGRIIVHYQPKLDLAERELVGVEALVRWMHPEFGLVSPAEFVEAIEATGSIDILLGHVLDIVLQQLQRLDSAGHPDHRGGQPVGAQPARPRTSRPWSPQRLRGTRCRPSC